MIPIHNSVDRIKRILSFSALLFLLSIGLGCTQTGGEGLLIGVGGPMTGDQSKQGQDIKKGVELAVSEWNDRGGILGKRIQVMVGDDQHDPKQAVVIANKFVNSGVVGVIGHYNSSATIPASEVYHQARLPMITPASTNPKVTDRGYMNVFRVCGRDDQQGRVAAEFVVMELKAKRVAILHDKTTYGQGLAEEFKKALSNRVKVTYFGGISQGDKDFRGVLTMIAIERPDVLYFGGIYPEAGLLAKQARAVGFKGALMNGDAVIDRLFILISGDAGEGSYLTYPQDVTKIPKAQSAVDRYRAIYGEPGPYSFYAYDAANVLLQGIKDAGSTEGEKISEAIHALSYEGVTGHIQFGPKGDVPKIQYMVWITRGGQFEEYWRPSGM